MRDDDRVLAIMVKAPRPGHVKTRLAGAYAAADVIRFYRALVEDTIDLARRAGVRTVAACPAGDEGELELWLPDDVDVLPQRGAGLAAGLLSTFEDLCTPSGRRVIAFNADSPHLPARVLTAAFDVLTTDDVVVGPCDDGGYYLVGATRPHPALFDAAMMGKDTACAALLARAGSAGLRAALVAEHYDVDLPVDVQRLAAELRVDPTRAPRTAAVLITFGRSHNA
jgi:uncharacterized protein